MRYLAHAEALTIAEAVTGTSAAALARASRLDLLDPALPDPISRGLRADPGGPSLGL